MHFRAVLNNDYLANSHTCRDRFDEIAIRAEAHANRKCTNGYSFRGSHGVDHCCAPICKLNSMSVKG